MFGGSESTGSSALDSRLRVVPDTICVGRDDRRDVCRADITRAIREGHQRVGNQYGDQYLECVDRSIIQVEGYCRSAYSNRSDRNSCMQRQFTPDSPHGQPEVQLRSATGTPIGLAGAISRECVGEVLPPPIPPQHEPTPVDQLIPPPPPQSEPTVPEPVSVQPDEIEEPEDIEEPNETENDSVDNLFYMDGEINLLAAMLGNHLSRFDSNGNWSDPTIPPSAEATRYIFHLGFLSRWDLNGDGLAFLFRMLGRIGGMSLRSQDIVDEWEPELVLLRDDPALFNIGFDSALGLEKQWSRVAVRALLGIGFSGWILTQEGASIVIDGLGEFESEDVSIGDLSISAEFLVGGSVSRILQLWGGLRFSTTPLFTWDREIWLPRFSLSLVFGANIGH